MLVYAPAHPRHAHRPDIVEYEVRRNANGDPVLPVFTSLKRLVKMLGPAQPWIAQPLTGVEQALAVAPGVRVLVDPDLAVDVWTWDENSLHAAMERAGIPEVRREEARSGR